MSDSNQSHKVCGENVCGENVDGEDISADQNTFFSKGVRCCRRCLYREDHPLGIVFDSEGICSGCRIHEEKDSLDWVSRWEKLVEITQPYRRKSPRSFSTRSSNINSMNLSHDYDCIVPVTGGHDSYYIVHTVKERLGLNPLLVSYNSYWNTPLGIRNLANLKIKFNCDLVLQNVNPLSVKNIVKTTLRRMGSIYWHCLAGQTVFPVQTAVRYKIPLIIWGAHQGLEQVGMFSHENEVEMTRRYRQDHDLMGYEADDLLSLFDPLNESDIWQYRYPDDADINEVGVRGIYLGNYVRWDQKTQHEQMINQYSYQTTRFSRTFNSYDQGHCYHYMNLHDRIKSLKHGYSRVVDDACREIRFGRITRNEAVKLVHYYQQRPSEYEHLFCDWLGIKADSMDFVLGAHVQGSKSHDDSLRSPNNKKISDPCINYDASHSINLDKKPAHIIVGKGI